MQTPVHTRTCVCCKCQSYVSIKYEAIVRHIQFIMIVIILIYCMNEQMRLKKSTWLKNDWYQYLLAQTCSLLIKITHGLFCSRLTFLCTTKNAMFWMLIIMWSHLINAVSNCLSLSLTVCTPLIFSCWFLAYCMILLAQHLPQGLPNEALSV